jgi:hypothetical protein
MTMQRITILGFCSTLAVLGSACDLGEKSIGNDTGADLGEEGDGDGEGEGDGDGDGDGDASGYCGEQTVSILDDLDATLAHFDASPNDYIAMSEGTYVGQFTWMSNDGPRTVEHAGTMSPLTIEIVYEGEVRLTEVELIGQFPGGELGGEPCGNRLEFDVSLLFATEDGLFVEAMIVPLRVFSHGESSHPSFYFSLDFDDFSGSLALDDFAFNDGEITDLILSGSFADGLVEGGLGMEVIFMDWIGFGSIAQFEAARQSPSP